MKHLVAATAVAIALGMPSPARAGQFEDMLIAERLAALPVVETIKEVLTYQQSGQPLVIQFVEKEATANRYYFVVVTSLYCVTKAKFLQIPPGSDAGKTILQGRKLTRPGYVVFKPEGGGRYHVWDAYDDSTPETTVDLLGMIGDTLGLTPGKCSLTTAANRNGVSE